ncbi:MAG: ABC transporter ATP-binding protein [Parvularculaceae bacterium]|nr:ABC transporter ATP-binding protein [Parvularculaceae bacterium]
MSLQLRDIRFGYGRDLVLDGVTLAANKGEIVCLFGPSGCGKSTVLRVAAGLETISEGAVELDGAVLSARDRHVSPETRDIGLVFQDFVLFQHMSVAENIAFGLSALAGPARRARVAEEIAAVGLNGLEARRPSQLSGGQQQRVALARAFARRPKALLLDEPFASIDAALRRRLRADLRRMLKDRNVPAIVVTHDADEAVELGDRIAIMRRGRIIEDASPERLWSAPATPEGALVFAGAQAIDADPAAFGALPGAGAAEGCAVVLAGGAVATASADGPARVADCRFEGPDWQITLESVAHPGLFLRALSSAPLTPGDRAAVRFEAARVRRFANRPQAD